MEASRSLPALEDLHEEIRTHGGCGFEPCESATHMVPGEGDPNAAIMIVGEAPGASEDEQGRPFVGRSGKLLDELLAAAGLEREQVYITNVVKARPPGNRDPRAGEIAHHMPWLEAQLALIQPQLIVPLGRHALAHFSASKISRGPRHRGHRARAHTVSALPPGRGAVQPVAARDAVRGRPRAGARALRAVGRRAALSPRRAGSRPPAHRRARRRGRRVRRGPSRASARAPPLPSSRTSICSSPFSRRQPDRGVRGVGVLGDVGERLGDREVRGRLGGGREAVLRHLDDLDLDGRAVASAAIAGARPRSVSTAGWMPRASSRSSADAS